MTRVRCVGASCRVARARLTPRALRASVSPSDRMGKQYNDDVRTSGAFLPTLEWAILYLQDASASEIAAVLGVVAQEPHPYAIVAKNAERRVRRVGGACDGRWGDRARSCAMGTTQHSRGVDYDARACVHAPMASDPDRACTLWNSRPRPSSRGRRLWS